MNSRALIFALLPLAFGCEVLEGNGELQREDRSLGAYSRLDLKAPLRVDVVEGAESGTAVKCDSNLLSNISTRVEGDRLTIRIVPPNAVFRPQRDCVVIVRQSKLESLRNDGSGRIVAGSDLSSEEIRNEGSGSIELRGLSADRLEVTNEGSGRITSTKLSVAEAELSLQGSGGLDFSAVDLQKISVINDGSGEVLIQGRTVEVKVVSSGSGEVVADTLVAANGRIDNDGSGSVKANVTEIVHVENTGSGSVRVTGSPVNVTRENSGSGSITIE